MYAERHVIDVTTDAAGDATAYTPVITGAVHSIRYVKDGTTPYADTVDFTITVEGTGEGLWTESNVTATKQVAPRQATHDLVGAASLYAAAGEPVEAPVVVAKDRVKIVLAQGGDTKTGRFHVVMA